ncbi:MAG TPA: protein phosphatase 2C domain-containing protein [Pirellulales bacterium]|nr:protein phosphatase 2C domain-containing protein [Pirellulales bacterium]
MDEEFCDHCNREICSDTIGVASIPSCLTFESGIQLDCSGWNQQWPSDPYDWLEAAANGRRFRLHGINPKDWRDVADDVERRRDVRLGVLSQIQIAALDGGAFVAAEAMPGARRTSQESVPARDEEAWPVSLDLLVDHCAKLVAAMAELHEAGYVWLNFDPNAIQLGEAGSQITNLDLAVYQKGSCPPSLRISPAYSPPEVCNFIGENIGPATDVFHLAMFAYYWLAGLLPGGFPGRGLQAFDFAVPPLRIYRPGIYPHVTPAIERGLARDPEKRPATVGVFLAELREAVDLAKSRYERDGGRDCNDHRPRVLKWRMWLGGRKVTEKPVCSIFGVTRTGRAKTAQGVQNQDSFRIEMMNHWFSTTRHLVLVADGVSNARAGSGELASQIACQLLGDELKKKDLASRSKFESAVTEACLKASSAIVSRALSAQSPASDLKDSDVMSTTAIIAVVDTDGLWLANIGDSRVYLVSGTSVEQLTVDGDVRCSLLASRGAPEEIDGMGNYAKSLRYCLGAAKATADGGFVPDEERSTPAFGYWPLQLGDVVVLCTDGLVDEGVFLDPVDLQRVVAENIGDSSQMLAERLVNKADSLQREPSAKEPYGFGDNITCVVAKIAAEC